MNIDIVNAGKRINIDIVNAGNCMICGKPINIVPELTSFPNIFLCPECEKKATNAKEEKDDQRRED